MRFLRKCTGLLSSDGVNSPETPGILVTPSSQPQDVVPVSSTSQLTTGTSSGNGALGSLMHYKTNDHFVENLSLLCSRISRCWRGVVVEILSQQNLNRTRTYQARFESHLDNFYRPDRAKILDLCNSLIFSR